MTDKPTIITGATELEQINTGLTAFDERMQSIQELVESTKGMSLATHSYKEISTKRKELKAARVSVEKEGKGLRDLIRPITLIISEKEKALVSIIDPEEERLSNEEEVYEAEQARIKKEREEAEMLIVNQRIEQLAQYGAAHDVTELKLLSDIAFENILNGHKEEWEAAEAKRIAEEEENRKALEELAQMKAAEEVRKRRIETRSEELRPYIVFIRNYQALLELEDEAYTKELADIKKGAELQWESDRKEQQRIANQQRELEEKQAELDRIEKQRINKRTELVIKAGLLLDTNNGFYKYDHLHIHSEAIKNLSDEEFYSEVEQLSIKVEAYKAKIIQDAVDAEQKRVADEMAAELELEKQRADEAAKKEAKRQAKLPDAKRLLEGAKEIVFNMPMPLAEDMKTDDGRTVLDWWKRRAEEFQAEIIAEIENKL